MLKILSISVLLIIVQFNSSGKPENDWEIKKSFEEESKTELNHENQTSEVHENLENNQQDLLKQNIENLNSNIVQFSMNFNIGFENLQKITETIMQIHKNTVERVDKHIEQINSVHVENTKNINSVNNKIDKQEKYNSKYNSILSQTIAKQMQGYKALLEDVNTKHKEIINTQHKQDKRIDKIETILNQILENQINNQKTENQINNQKTLETILELLNKSSDAITSINDNKEQEEDKQN